MINGNGGVSIDPTLGFSDKPYTQTAQLEVYPNPSTDYISIKDQTETLFFTFYDANGKTVQTGTIDPDGLIDVRTLKSGAYILKFVEPNQQH